MVKNESHFHMAMDVEDTKTPWPDVTDKCVCVLYSANPRILSYE